MTFDTARLLVGGGGVAFAIGTVWVLAGWLVNGYPDGMSFIIATAGGVMVTVGALAIVYLNPPRPPHSLEGNDE